MEEIYRNRILNYGYITFLSLICIILIFNILMGSFDKFTGNINLSDFSIKFILILVIVISYLTLSVPSFKILGENKILKRTPPRGDKGPRGNRGGVGENAACKECGDDLCFKKIMFNITKTINFWKQQNGMELLDDNYIIENEYIKDKVKKHCKSKQFKTLMTKYGANNKNSDQSPTDISTNNDIGFGAYDYMFKMWSVWILTILRYKNGMLFLESYGLNENDFDGLIEKEDAFPIGTYVTKTGADRPLYTIVNNSEFPFFNIKNNTTNALENQVYINNLEAYYPTSSDTRTDLNQEMILDYWDDMFEDEDVSSANIKQKLIKLSKVKRHNEGIYNFEGINQTFISEIGKVPGGGKYNPFHEIKKYSSWLWGSDPNSKPRFTIERTPENKVCRSCQNSSLCNYSNPSIGIKVKYTNSYKTLVNLSKFTNSNDDYIKPFQSLSSDDINIDSEYSNASASNNFYKKILENSTIFRPQTLIDESEHHPLFRTYKPVGDVIINNDNYELKNGEGEKCRPSDMSYEDEIFEAVIGIGNKSSNSPSSYNNYDHIYTLLVSGDTKPPKDYTLVGSYLKEKGINKNFEAISIWKPIPESGYVALGFVFDTRPFIKDTQPPKPPRDLIATIPECSLNELGIISNLNKLSIDFLKEIKINNSNITNINTLSDIDNFNSPIRCSSEYKYVCSPDSSINTVSSNIADKVKVKNGGFKNKKYSIQKIFDNNNE